MNPDSPSDQQLNSSPLPLAPPPQMYHQAPSLTPPISAPSNEAEAPILGSEEESVHQPGPIAIEPMAPEEPCLKTEDPFFIPTTTPVPVSVPVAAPEFIESDAVEMTPAVPTEILQTEPILGDVEAVTETPTGKRPRTKKPKSAAKTGKSKAKKETTDSWMDGEALSSAGADTNDEVLYFHSQSFILKFVNFFCVYFQVKPPKPKRIRISKKKSKKGDAGGEPDSGADTSTVDTSIALGDVPAALESASADESAAALSDAAPVVSSSKKKKPKVKSASPSKKKPTKTTINFSKKNRKRALCDDEDKNSDLEVTPPPSPLADDENSTLKRRSGRNTNR